MAVTIVRTPWIDDDGTGSTGTVINNAVKTALYNDIDGALAKVAQLAGGNSFTGTQAMAAALTVTGPVLVNTGTNPGIRMLVATDAAVTPYGVGVLNTNAGVNLNIMPFFNSALALMGSISQASATTVAYNTSSDARLKDDAGRAGDLAALRAVVVHDFTWKADGRRARGVFAQEAAAVFPSAITKGTDEMTEGGDLAQPWMTDYSKFVPDLIVGWQQHDDTLAEIIACLERMKG